MKKKIHTPLLTKTLQKIAHKIGAHVVMEPEWGIVCQINFKNGKRRYARYSSIDLNSMGASEVAKDKDYANFFMKRMGYPTIKGKTFFSKSWAKVIHSNRTIDSGYIYAKKLEFPVIVKPNGGSQGNGVALVYNKKEFYKAMNFIFKNDKVALIQQKIIGKDYRIVVLDDKIISGYERIPLNIIGDGKRTILGLLKEKRTRFDKNGRDASINIYDPRIYYKLKHQGLHFNSLPKKGEVIYLLDNANLSTGGDSIDVTNKIHPLFKKIAIKLTKDMGLRLCGVDIMIDGDISQKPSKYSIIEVNSAPGLDHYVTTGKAQEKIVEDLYLKVLKSMEK